MFPDYCFSLSIPSFLCHPSSFALLSCPTDLLLLICVISTFYLHSLSLPQPCLHYVFVYPSLLPFNLFSETSGIFGLVMYNSSVEGMSVFIACKLELYKPPTPTVMCVNMQLVPNESRTACRMCVNEVFGFILTYCTVCVCWPCVVSSEPVYGSMLHKLICSSLVKTWGRTWDQISPGALNHMKKFCIINLFFMHNPE